MQGQSRIKYEIPTRGLLGLKNALLSSTRGTAVLNTQFLRYDTFLGDFSTRELGSLTAFETGQVTAYALQSAQARGTLFCKPGQEVYEGQVVGIHQRAGDLGINVCKKKALTNMRASGKDHAVALDGVKDYSLDDWCAALHCPCACVPRQADLLLLGVGHVPR
jgi:GTP-binding protein